MLGAAVSAPILRITHITFFMGNKVLNIFHLTICSKKATFLGKMGGKNFGGFDNFLREGVVLH